MSTTARALPLPDEFRPQPREWTLFLRRLGRRRTALFGAVVVVIVLVTALAAAWISPFDPLEQAIGDRLKPPGWRDAAGQAHLLGTDHLGRDILARIVHGAQPALLVGVIAVQLGHKLGGSVITESVFAMNGLGRLALEAILGADLPTIQMLVFVFALTFVLLTLAADLLNAWLDPRIRLR